MSNKIIHHSITEHTICSDIASDATVGTINMINKVYDMVINNDEIKWSKSLTQTCINL